MDIKELTVARVLYEIALHNGISSYKLAKKLDVNWQSLIYRLNKLVDMKILRREKTRYYLDRDTFISNGKAVVKKGKVLLFLDCPFYPCKSGFCNGNFNPKKYKPEDCPFLEGMDEKVKNEIKKELGII